MGILVARPGCKLVQNVQSKMYGWKPKFIFMGVLDDFPLPRVRAVEGCRRDPKPKLSEKYARQAKALQGMSTQDT